MGSLNKQILIGHLGADPELRSTQSGQPVANLRIATSDSWEDKQTGNRKERTEWHAVTVWGKQAEICGRYLSKGRQVYVEGRTQTREYQAQDGTTRQVKEVVAKQIVFLSGKGDDANSNSAGRDVARAERQPAGWGGPGQQSSGQTSQSADLGWNLPSGGNDGIPF